MNYIMHGLNEEYETLFHEYRQTGIHAVASGDNPAAMEAATKFGLAYYVCTGAFGTSNTDEFCIDINGDPATWFGSGCPNHPALRERSLKKAKDTAGLPNLKGIILDGARFASPASAEGPEGFFTCFCPHCMAKINDFGFDAQYIKHAVRDLYLAIKKGVPFNTDAVIPGLKDWLCFRRICITEYVKAYVSGIKSVNPAVETALYLFAPSLSALTGQNYQDIASICDFVSPMIYRHFKHPSGPACLDHEYAAIGKYLEGKSNQVKRSVLDAFEKLASVDYSRHGSPDFLAEHGVPPEVVAEEANSAASLSGTTPVIPIILLDDALLYDTLAGLQGLVKATDFYVYEPKAFEKAKPVLKQFRR